MLGCQTGCYVKENAMKLTTRRGENGSYEVLVDGHGTGIRLAKGETPRWGMTQEWSIGVCAEDGTVDWIVADQRGKALALETVAKILKAAKR